MTLTLSRCFFYQVCVCFLLFISIAQADNGDIAFSNGVKAYKEANYSRALHYFTQAEKAGYQSGQLFHNLGVVSIKLDQLNRAWESFTKTLDYPAIAPLGHYNLGLIAANRGDIEIANKHFEQAINISQDPALTELARKRLSAQGKNSAAFVGSKQWKILARVGRGHDDNVNFTPDEVSSGIDDGYTELLFYGSAMFTKNQPVGIGVDAYVYDVNYDDIDSNNYLQNSVLLKFPLQYGRWKIQPGLMSQWSKYGGKDYQKIKGLELKSRYIKNDTTHYLFKYSYEDINSLNSQYDFLEGSRHKLRLGNEHRQHAYRTNIYYELEVNERNDKTGESFSPRRHTLNGLFTYALSHDFSMNGNVKYRLSDYPDVGDFERDDKRLQVSWGGQFRINKYTALKGLHTWTKNDSSDSNRDYDRHRLAFSLQFSY